MSDPVTLPFVVHVLRPDGTPRCTNVELEASRYVDNGNIALAATCTDESYVMQDDGTQGEACTEGEPWSVMTVNPGIAYGDDYVCVKDYSEGSGNLKTLLTAGLVKEPEDWISSGYVQIPVCKLTPKGKTFVAASLKARKPEDGEGLA